MESTSSSGRRRGWTGLIAWHCRWCWASFHVRQQRRRWWHKTGMSNFLNAVLTNFVRFGLSTTFFLKRYFSSSSNCYGTPWRRQHHLYKSSLKSPHMRSPTLRRESPTLSSSNSNTCHQKNGKWCEFLSKLHSTRQACTSKLLLSLSGLTWPICSSTSSTTGTWRRQLPITSKHLPRMSLLTRFWKSNWS